MKFPHRIHRQALGTTPPVRPVDPQRPGMFAGKEERKHHADQIAEINQQHKADVNAYAAQELNNRKVARRESLPGAQTKLGQSVAGKRVGDFTTDMLMDSTPQAVGYGAAGLGLTAMGLADPLHVYSEGGLLGQDPLAQARYRAARSMEIAGTPAVAQAIFEDQLNQTVPGSGYLPESDRPAELQFPRGEDNGYYGNGNYAMGAHVPGIDVQHLVDVRAKELMGTPYETSDGDMAIMSYPTAVSRAETQVSLELRANGIL